MASTIMEQTRAAQEECERLEKIVCKDLQNEAKGFKEVLQQNHRVSRMLDTIQERSKKVMKIYLDEDCSRKDEISALGAGNTFSLFYDRLKEVRDYHRRYPNLMVPSALQEEEALLTTPVPIEFSGEEAHGKYLDLHLLYDEFQNARFGQKIDYLTFLSCFLAFGSIKREEKFSAAYRDYLQRLLDYLVSFHKRTKPLTPLPKILAKVDEEFERKWVAGEVMGWEDQGKGTDAGEKAKEGAVDLDAFSSADELVTLGAEILKDGLMALGLKSGGSAQQRAERLWLTKGRPLESLDRKLFAKGHVPVASLSGKEAERRARLAREVALLELKGFKMGEHLEGVAEATRGNVEKKSSMTVEEMEAELAEQEEEAAQEEVDSDDEQVVYNPLKLPMGWDGKPIPYWLYKLHGLNQEFKCEICGNYSYWGRRAFERHFREARHQHGMKCLEIPNSKQFYEITKIEDAKSLWAALQARNEGGWEPEMSEEFEDGDGNVYNKKTYQDLKRQGLI